MAVELRKRKAHNKSRNGCLSCKKIRLKVRLLRNKVQQKRDVVVNNILTRVMNRNLHALTVKVMATCVFILRYTGRLK
jgi:stress-induced morphogen